MPCLLQCVRSKPPEAIGLISYRLQQHLGVCMHLSKVTASSRLVFVLEPSGQYEPNPSMHGQPILLSCQQVCRTHSHHDHCRGVPAELEKLQPLLALIGVCYLSLSVTTEVLPRGSFFNTQVTQMIATSFPYLQRYFFYHRPTEFNKVAGRVLPLLKGFRYSSACGAMHSPGLLHRCFLQLSFLCRKFPKCCCMSWKTLNVAARLYKLRITLSVAGDLVSLKLAQSHRQNWQILSQQMSLCTPHHLHLCISCTKPQMFRGNDVVLQLHRDHRVVCHVQAGSVT